MEVNKAAAGERSNLDKHDLGDCISPAKVDNKGI